MNEVALLGKEFGTIVFDVYQRGKLVKSQGFWEKHYGNFFATDLSGIPTFSLQYGFGRPKLAVPLDTRVVVHLLWEIPGFGKVMLRADNEGKGYLLTQKEKMLDLVLLYELAKSHFAWVSRVQAQYVSSGYEVSTEYLQRMEKAKDLLDKAKDVKDSPEECSRFAEDALREVLFAGEILELDVAEQVIAEKRKKGFLFGFFNYHFDGFD